LFFMTLIGKDQTVLKKDFVTVWFNLSFGKFALDEQ